MCVYVDEAWCNYLATRVNGAFAAGFGKVADGGDSAITNADVAGIPGRAGAVDDVAFDDDEVEWAIGGEGESRDR